MCAAEPRTTRHTQCAPPAKRNATRPACKSLLFCWLCRDEGEAETGEEIPQPGADLHKRKTAGFLGYDSLVFECQDIFPAEPAASAPVIDAPLFPVIKQRIGHEILP